MEGALDNFELLLTAEAAEVNGVSRYANGERWIKFWMFHGIEEDVAVHDVDVEMMGAAHEVAIEDGRQEPASTTDLTEKSAKMNLQKESKKTLFLKY